LKVVVTIPWGAKLGGAELILWDFLVNLDRNSVEPVLVFLNDGPFIAEAREHGFRAEAIPSGRLRQPIRFARTVGKLVRLLRREQPDVLLNWSAKTHVYGGTAAALARFSERTIWWQQTIPDGGWLDRLATRIPSGAIGCYSAAAAKAQARISPHRTLRVVHPGTAEPPPLVVDVRARFDIPTERFVVGCVARLHAEKRQHLILETVALLRRRGLDAHALLVGEAIFGLSAGYEQFLREQIEELGLEGAATLTGHVTNVGDYIRAMDVVVSASARESFGVNLIEAMALARPVVAFGGSGGPDEILDHGRTGLLVGEDGPSPLADEIERLARDDRLRARLVTEGRREFEQLYHSREAARAFELALRRVADRTP